MSPDKGSKKPSLVKLDCWRGVKVREVGGVRVRMGLAALLGKRDKVQYQAVYVRSV